jgi:hypothetical protein
MFDNGHKPKGWSFEATGRYVATGSDNFSHLCPVFRGRWVILETVLSLPGLRLGRKRARLRDSGVLVVPTPQRDRVTVARTLLYTCEATIKHVTRILKINDNFY